MSKTLSQQATSDLLSVLENRFQENKHRHKNQNWNKKIQKNNFRFTRK